eukprot:30729-Pelagococcus_subviridis.AAC.2
MGGETRRAKSLRIGVHNADAVVWGPVYRTHLALALPPRAAQPPRLLKLHPQRRHRRDPQRRQRTRERRPRRDALRRVRQRRAHQRRGDEAPRHRPPQSLRAVRRPPPRADVVDFATKAAAHLPGRAVREGVVRAARHLLRDRVRPHDRERPRDELEAEEPDPLERVLREEDDAVGPRVIHQRAPQRAHHERHERPRAVHVADLVRGETERAREEQREERRDGAPAQEREEVPQLGVMEGMETERTEESIWRRRVRLRHDATTRRGVARRLAPALRLPSAPRAVAKTDARATRSVDAFLGRASRRPPSPGRICRRVITPFNARSVGFDRARAPIDGLVSSARNDQSADQKSS